MSALSVLPAPSRPRHALTVARAPEPEPAAGRRVPRAEARAAEQVRACVVAVVLGGAVVTVPLMMLAVFVPELWTLPFLAALHTPVFAAMAGHRLTRRLAAAPLRMPPAG
ncbi:MAG TPA: hypothetical protein VFX52_09315 [Nocardioidaceae bacterium]|nr:hypothetical protein [Nocardioidaceae bacterium]